MQITTLVHNLTILSLSLIFSGCSDRDEDKIPTVKELSSMSSDDGSENFNRFIEMVEDYEATQKDSN